MGRSESSLGPCKQAAHRVVTGEGHCMSVAKVPPPYFPRRQIAASRCGVHTPLELTHATQESQVMPGWHCSCDMRTELTSNRVLYQAANTILTGHAKVRSLQDLKAGLTRSKGRLQWDMMKRSLPMTTPPAGLLLTLVSTHRLQRPVRHSCRLYLGRLQRLKHSILGTFNVFAQDWCTGKDLTCW